MPVAARAGSEAGQGESRRNQRLLPATPPAIASRRLSSCRNRASSRCKGTMFGPSLRAWSGTGGTSRNSPSTPTATGARARGATNSRWPPRGGSACGHHGATSGRRPKACGCSGGYNVITPVWGRHGSGEAGQNWKLPGHSSREAITGGCGTWGCGRNRGRARRADDQALGPSKGRLGGSGGSMRSRRSARCNEQHPF